MKALDYLKKSIWWLLGLLILSISLYVIYNYYEEKRFIKECIETCSKDIYGYMTQEDSTSYFGHYNIKVGTQSISLKTIFYEDYIINKTYIMTYLESLNWQDIITFNNKNMPTIITYVRQEYITEINIRERGYTLQLLQSANLGELKKKIHDLLISYVDNSQLNVETLEEHLNKKIINIIYNLEKRKQEDEKKDKEENKELYEMKKRLEEQIENWYQNNHKKK